MFRISFGLLVAASMIRFVAKGWVESLYLAPAHHLTYARFEWVRPLPYRRDVRADGACWR